MIQTEIKNKLSDEILFGRLAKGGDFELEMDGEQILFQIPVLEGMLEVKELVTQD